MLLMIAHFWTKIIYTRPIKDALDVALLVRGV